jgi:hypothetical protein
MEARMTKLAQVADVIVVQMRDDAVGYRIRIDIEELHTLDRTTQKLAAAASAYFLGKSSVDPENPIQTNDGPREVVHRHGTVVRVTADEMVGPPRITGRILDCEDFVLGQLLSHVSPSLEDKAIMRP